MGDPQSIYKELPYFDADLAWKVAAKGAEHCGGTLKDLFAYGETLEFPTEAWESLWLIVGPPLAKEMELEALQKEKPK